MWCAYVRFPTQVAAMVGSLTGPQTVVGTYIAERGLSEIQLTSLCMQKQQARLYRSLTTVDSFT